MLGDTKKMYANIQTQQGSISKNTLKACDDFLRSCNSSLPKIKVLWMMTGNFSASNCLLRYCNPLSGVLGYSGISSGNYSETSGITFPASNAYATAGFIPNNYSSLLTSFAIFGYSHTSGTHARVFAGFTDGTNGAQLFPRYTDGNCYFRAWNDTGGSVSFASSDGSGFIAGSRMSSSDSKIYRNRTQSATSSSSGGSLPSIEIWLAGVNSSGSPLIADAACRYSMIGLSDGLSLSETIQIQNAYEKFMSTIGRS